MINTILIVDDSPVARKMLKSVIPKDKGYEIFEAVNGQEGAEKYQEIGPDVTLMDLTMPVLDGFGSMKKILEVNKSALVVIITADTQQKSISTAMELGAFTLLKKPVTAETMVKTLAKVELNIKKK